MPVLDGLNELLDLPRNVVTVAGQPVTFCGLTISQLAERCGELLCDFLHRGRCGEFLLQPSAKRYRPRTKPRRLANSAPLMPSSTKINDSSTVQPFRSAYSREWSICRRTLFASSAMADWTVDLRVAGGDHKTLS